ncbi:MAG: alginate lyase family protein [Gemmatimonadaceae bacterium]
MTDATRALAQSRPFFSGVENSTTTVEAIRSGAPGHIKETLERAAAVTRGEIAILGHGLVCVGTPPKWQREPIAGLTAPQKHWSRVPYLNPSIVGDHKVVWEFNRHQYFVTLGQAWKYSQNDLWPRVFAEHLRSWIEGNPATVGMNWASSLEVSYRAISWIWALHLMRDASVLQGELADTILASVQAHGRHLERYLSTYFSPNTHLTGEALGLFYIGTQYPMLRDAKRWRALGAEVLEASLKRQVLSDGVYFEQATQYHRYTIEIYLHYLLLARANNIAVSDRIEATLHTMFDVLLHLTRADGTIPLIGDDDGGRLVQLDDRPPHDVRALLAMGAVVLKRSDLAWVGRGDDAALCWMLGAGAPRERDALVAGPPTETSRAFPDGGLFTMRDGWGTTDGHIAIDAGPHGGLSFGHSHADALSVEISVGGKPLFVDAGTFTYMGVERNAFRTSVAHNTVEIDAESACIPSTPFRWKTVAHATASSWQVDEDFTYFAGAHDGYGRLASPVQHERSVLNPARGIWIVCDDLRGVGAHDAVLRWHSAHEVSASLESSKSGTAVIALKRAGIVQAVLVLSGGKAGKGEVSKGWVSPQFGKKAESDVCSWRERITGDARLVSVVIDGGLYAVNSPDQGVRPDPITNGFRVSFRSIDEAACVENVVTVGAGGPITVGDVVIDAAMGFVELNSLTNKARKLVAVGAKNITSNGAILHQDRAGLTWIVAKSDPRGSAGALIARSGQLALKP